MRKPKHWPKSCHNILPHAVFQKRVKNREHDNIKYFLSLFYNLNLVATIKILTEKNTVSYNFHICDMCPLMNFFNANYFLLTQISQIFLGSGVLGEIIVSWLWHTATRPRRKQHTCFGAETGATDCSEQWSFHAIRTEPHAAQAPDTYFPICLHFPICLLYSHFKRLKKLVTILQ